MVTTEAPKPKFDGSMEQFINRSIPKDPALRAQYLEEYQGFAELGKKCRRAEVIAGLCAMAAVLGTMLFVKENLFATYINTWHIPIVLAGGGLMYGLGKISMQMHDRGNEARNAITAMQHRLYAKR